MAEEAAERCGPLRVREATRRRPRERFGVGGVLTPRMRAALVTAMVEARDWNPKACGEAIDRMDATGRFQHQAFYVSVVGRYVSALTEDGRPRFTTPALLADEGEHWTHTPIEGRKARAICTTHGLPFPCEDCKTDPNLKPLDDPKSWRATYKQRREQEAQKRRQMTADQEARRDAARHEAARKKAQQLDAARAELHQGDQP